MPRFGHEVSRTRRLNFGWIWRQRDQTPNGTKSAVTARPSPCDRAVCISRPDAGARGSRSARTGCVVRRDRRGRRRPSARHGARPRALFEPRGAVERALSFQQKPSRCAPRGGHDSPLAAHAHDHEAHALRAPATIATGARSASRGCRVRTGRCLRGASRAAAAAFASTAASALSASRAGETGSASTSASAAGVKSAAAAACASTAAGGTAAACASRASRRGSRRRARSASARTSWARTGNAAACAEDFEREDEPEPRSSEAGLFLGRRRRRWGAEDDLETPIPIRSV